MFKFKFQDLDYQNNVSDSIVDLFKGTTKNNHFFNISQTQDFTDTRFWRNNLQKTKNIKRLWENLNHVQKRNFETLTTKDDFNKNFKTLEYDIEMEIGTGKTIVYTDAIYKLNKAYDFTKFIILVPTKAIREGVAGSMKSTSHFFKNKHNRIMNCKIYDSRKLGRVTAFATSENIRVLIMTINSINMKENIATNEHEAFGDQKPIDWIAETNPIVIVDEPQLTKSTKKQKTSIQELNPLFILNFSATFREKTNVIYTLNPLESYKQKLVKRISVLSVTDKDTTNSQYFDFQSIALSEDHKPVANVNLKFRTSPGNFVIKNAKLKLGAKLENVTKNKIYQGITLARIDADNELIAFTDEVNIDNDLEMNLESDIIIDPKYDNEVDYIKASQIRNTIKIHIEKQAKLFDKKIKVLSLFFIDEVAKYRVSSMKSTKDKSSNGQYANYFENSFKDLIINKDDYWPLTDPYNKEIHEFINKYYRLEDIHKYHEGYFAQDKKANSKNTGGDSEIDVNAYDLILKNKEKLISFRTLLAFIFSHSALREGWDNPNVFQICSLNLNKKSKKNDEGIRRQEIGRGLRLCFDKYGNRVNEIDDNNLTIVTIENYAKFVKNLQTEYHKNGFQLEQKITPKTFRNFNEDAYEIFNILKEKGHLQEGILNSDFLKRIRESDTILKYEFGTLLSPQDILKLRDNLLNKNRFPEIKNENEKLLLQENKNFKYKNKLEELLSYLYCDFDFKLQIDEQALIKKCTEKINSSFVKPKERKIEAVYTKLRLSESNQDFETHSIRKRTETITSKQLGYSLFEKQERLQFVKNLSKSTNLLSRSIVKILNALDPQISKALSFNYELSEKRLSEIINDVKMNFVAENIYFKFRGKGQPLKINPLDKVIYKSTNYINLENYDDFQKQKYFFNTILLDSKQEENFAKEVLAQESVEFFHKLQRERNKIKLPFYNYTPDFALSLIWRSFLISEIKGSNKEQDLRKQELLKIKIAKEYFKCFEDKLVRSLKNNVDSIKYQWGEDFDSILEGQRK